MFRQIYIFDDANEAISVLKSTMSGKLFHTLTIRSLKNLARTVEEERFSQQSICSLCLWYVF